MVEVASKQASQNLSIGDIVTHVQLGIILFSPPFNAAHPDSFSVPALVQ
jgi:hypothetical protein